MDASVDMMPAINSLSLMRVPAILRNHSIAPLEFLSRTGVSPNLFSGGGRWLPRDLCFTMVEQAVHMTGNPFFGAEVGAIIALADLGDYGNRILSAATLGEALRVAKSDLGQIHRGAALRFEKCPREIVIPFQFNGRLGADPIQYHLGTMAVLRTIALLAGEPDGVRLQLASPYRRGASVLEAHLGSNITFGAASDAVIIDRDLLALPVGGKAMRSATPDTVSILRTAELILELMPEGGATLHNIAGRLQTRERTLQRKLAKFGVTFEQLLDATRRDEALRLVAQGGDSLISIALQLGYSEQANFNRAFRRWTGSQPSAYRGNDGTLAPHLSARSPLQ